MRGMISSDSMTWAREIGTYRTRPGESDCPIFDTGIGCETVPPFGMVGRYVGIVIDIARGGAGWEIQNLGRRMYRPGGGRKWEFEISNLSIGDHWTEKTEDEAADD
jgi:hypothetical protein